MALSQMLPPPDWSQGSDRSHDGRKPAFELWTACRACRNPACSCSSSWRRTRLSACVRLPGLQDVLALTLAAGNLVVIRIDVALAHRSACSSLLTA